MVYSLTLTFPVYDCFSLWDILWLIMWVPFEKFQRKSRRGLSWNWFLDVWLKTLQKAHKKSWKSLVPQTLLDSQTHVIKELTMYLWPERGAVVWFSLLLNHHPLWTLTFWEYVTLCHCLSSFRSILRRPKTSFSHMLQIQIYFNWRNGLPLNFDLQNSFIRLGSV